MSFVFSRVEHEKIYNLGARFCRGSLCPLCSGNHLTEEEIARQFDYCVLAFVSVCILVSLLHGAIGRSVIVAFLCHMHLQ